MKKFIGSKRVVVCLCAVLVAVSAFFYVPMDVSAQISRNYNFYNANVSVTNLKDPEVIYLKDYLPSDSGFYRISFDLTVNVSSDVDFKINNLFVGINSPGLYQQMSVLSSDYVSSYQHTERRYIFIDASTSRDYSALSIYYFMLPSVKSLPTSATFDFSYDFAFNNATLISEDDYLTYQNGYNAGYSAGEQVGESNGYSNGYSDGFIEGEQSGYDSGFQAGSESVDTESYYDAGYNAGYNVGYFSGYEVGYDEGYDEGYEDALKTIDGLGGDSTSYPVHVITLSDSNTHTSAYPKYGQTTDLVYTPYSFNFTSANLKAKNVYCFSGIIDKAILYANGYSNFTDAEIFLDVGGLEYSICTMPSADTYYSPGFKVFVPGDRMSSVATIKVKVYGAVGNDAQVEPYINLLTNSCTMYLQDYGPINSAQQNVIANQTDILEGTLEEQKEIQQGQLEEQKEQTETQKGIAASIKEFFGSFFDNLINSIIHVIVPTKEEMGELFNRLNDFFSETFGFLYYPFEFIINAFNIFLVADSGTGLTLPAFSIMGYEVWGNQTYDIASEPIVGEIFGFVRMGTGAMLVMWFVNFLKDFFDKRFGGGGN